MAKTKVKIFVWMKKIYPHFVSDIYQQIFLGSKINPNRVVMIKDDIGEDNISEKLPLYGKLTGFYWAFKNYLEQNDMEYFGFCKYDSFLDFSVHPQVNKMFLPLMIADFEKMFKEYEDEKIYNEIKNYDVVVAGKIPNEKNLPYLKDLLEIIRLKTPEFNSALEKTFNVSSIYTNIAFVMKKNEFYEYLTWLFRILFEFEHRIIGASENAFENLEPFMFNVWINYKDLSVKTTTSVSVPMDIF